MKNKLEKEIESFQDLWPGGFRRSLYDWDHQVAEESPGLDLNALKKKCIDPYVDKNTTVLEIGTDGGFWLNFALRNGKKLIGMDIRTAEKTNFWHHLKRWNADAHESFFDKIQFVMNGDFKCSCLSDNIIDYVFSYDVFCHISLSGTKQYLKHLRPKLTKGANLFIMIADGDKYFPACPASVQKHIKLHNYNNWEEALNDYDGDPLPGRWYFYGVKRFCEAAKEYGYTIVNEDAAKDIDKRNPIIHLRYD